MPGRDARAGEVDAPGPGAPDHAGQPTPLHVDDDGFVRAPAPLVYATLTDVGAWPQWWPGIRVQPMSRPKDTERWAVELAVPRREGAFGAPLGVRRLRLAVRPHGWRQDTGMWLELTGDLRGAAELWLEPRPTGTVVHHLLWATTDARHPARRHRDYRRALRRGLWALADRVQGEVRAAAGLTP